MRVWHARVACACGMCLWLPHVVCAPSLIVEDEYVLPAVGERLKVLCCAPREQLADELRLSTMPPVDWRCDAQALGIYELLSKQVVAGTMPAHPAGRSRVIPKRHRDVVEQGSVERETTHVDAEFARADTIPIPCLGVAPAGFKARESPSHLVISRALDHVLTPFEIRCGAWRQGGTSGTVKWRTNSRIQWFEECKYQDQQRHHRS